MTYEKLTEESHIYSVNLLNSQVKALRRRASQAKPKSTMSALIRKAIDFYLAESVQIDLNSKKENENG